MTNKTLLSKQVNIILWLLAAAIAAIETYAQYKQHGFAGWRLYFFALIFIVCVVMYFIKKKQRLENR
jgi:hypothetical protein